MAIEYQKPNQKTIEFLRNGLIIFYPDKVAGIFNLRKGLIPQADWKEYGLAKFQFESYLQQVFGSTNPAFCASQIRKWLADPNIVSNVPANLNELVAENEEAKAIKAEHEAQRLKEQAILRKQQEIKRQQVAAKPAEAPKIAPPETISEEAAKGEVVTPTPEEAPPPEIAAIGINFVRGRPNLFKQPPAQIRVSAIKAAARNAFPQIQEQYGGNITTGIALFLKGVPSKTLLEKSSGLPGSASQLVANLEEIVARLESDNNLTRLISDASGPVSDLQFTFGPLAKTGVSDFTIYYSPDQPNVSVLSPEEGAPSVFSSLAWALTKRISGKYAEKALTGLISRAVAKGAAKAGTTLAAEAATTAAVEAGAATLGAEGGAAAGTAVGGPVGALIGLLIGLLIGAAFGLIEKFFKWMKKNGQDLLFGSVAIVAYGSFIGSSFLIYSGLGVGTLAILNGGLSGLGKGFFRLSSNVIGLMTTIVLPSIGAPFLIGLLATPLAIAIIIFIINAGAYIVPPSTIALSESPYVGVSKTVSPAGPFQNGDIPFTVEYTITIVAKKDTLTNISFNDECKFIKKDSSRGCPPISGTIPPPPQEISPTLPFSFKYSRAFDSNAYFDSATINTLTVIADSPEQKGAKASGGASVIIGNPPIGCFTFDNSWDADKTAKEMAAIEQLSQATTYMATLCEGGNITLTYNGDPSINYGGEIINGGITIYHHGLDLGLTGAVYVIAHESGHIYSIRTSAYSLYMDDDRAAAERPICTYPFNPHVPSEDFAEMIGLYVAKRASTINAACLTNFKTQYPNHWRFARYNIFFEDLGW